MRTRFFARWWTSTFLTGSMLAYQPYHDHLVQFALALLLFTVCYTGLLFTVTDPISPYGLFVRTLYLCVTIGSAIVYAITALREYGRRKWAWTLQMIQVLAGSCVWSLQLLYMSRGQTQAAAGLTPFYLLVYIIAIVSVAVYFPRSVWQLGNAPRVIVDSVTIACAVVFLTALLVPHPIRQSIMWLGLDVGLVFAMLVVCVRVGRRGGPLVRFASASIVALFLADIGFTFLPLIPDGQQWVFLLSPLYMLNIAFLALGASLSTHYPQPSTDDASITCTDSEFRLWTEVPRLLIFLVIAAIVVIAIGVSLPLLALVVFGFVRELFAEADQRRLFGRLAAANAALTAARGEAERTNAELVATNQALEAANQQLRAYMVQAEDLAVEQERVRVAREIHDGLGHHLNNVKVHVGVAYRAFEADPPVALDSLSIAKMEIRNAQRELRHAVDALVSNDHLACSLEDLLSEPIRDCQLAGINVDFTVIGTPRSPSEQIKHVLYRIGQEALNNVRQHAYAKRATFQIHYQEQQIQIVVEDDGVGLPDSVEQRRGHGLDNLQERAALVGGKAELETRPGQGVRVVVEVPYGPDKGLDRR